MPSIQSAITTAPSSSTREAAGAAPPEGARSVSAMMAAQSRPDTSWPAAVPSAIAHFGRSAANARYATLAVVAAAASTKVLRPTTVKPP